MSTLFVRHSHWQVVIDVPDSEEEPLLLVASEDIVVSPLVASKSNSSSIHFSISGAIQPAVPWAIDPYVVDTNLD